MPANGIFFLFKCKYLYDEITLLTRHMCFCCFPFFHSSPQSILTWASFWPSSWWCRWFASFCSSRSNWSRGEARLVRSSNNLRNCFIILPVWVCHNQTYARVVLKTHPDIRRRALFFQSARLEALRQATVAPPLIDSPSVPTKSSRWRLTVGRVNQD